MFSRRHAFVVLYAASGAAALVYEITWTRLLTLFMGHTVAAANSFAECSDELSLAVNEACANAMIHTSSRFVDVRFGGF